VAQHPKMTLSFPAGFSGGGCGKEGIHRSSRCSLHSLHTP